MKIKQQFSGIVLNNGARHDLEIQQALNHSYELLKYIIEHSREAVAVHDRDMRYIFVSQRYLQDFVREDVDIIGKNHYEVMPNLPQRWKDAHQAALKGKIVKNEEDFFEKTDGTIEWTRWECRPWYQADNSIGGIIVFTEMITERKKFELALKRSEIQLNSIFNSTPLLMMLINEKDEVLKMNKFGFEATSKEKMNGLKPGDILSCVYSFETPGGCGHGPDCRNCILRNTIDGTFKTGREHYKVESSLITKENDQEKNITILISTSIIASIPEKQVLITIDDISDRKQLEHDLIKARDKAEESDKLKSAFLANISHEIRTPMNGIMGFSDMLTNPNLTEEKRKQFSLLIQDGCRQLLGIITDVIDISMLDSRQISIVDSEFSINDFMQELFLMFRSIANNKNINLFYNNGITKLKILSDREKLKHVFSNLISNAIKFTSQGKIEFGYNLREDEIEFYVSDTGIGINQDLHDAIFERFRQVETSDTRNYSGAGLGLSIAKSLVNLLGGDIWLKSEPGEGTTFYFSVPARIIEKDSLLTSENLTGIQNQHENEILIAEDDELNFLFIQEVLNEINLYPLHAKNGAEAIALFRKYPSLKLILMDIKMPIIDGYEATRSIREVDTGIPIIAQTAYSLPGNIRELSKSGFTGIISKPIDKEKLEWLVMQYLY